VPDEDLERPSLVPPWLTLVVIVLAIFGAFAIVGWVVNFAFGIAKLLFFILLVVAAIAVVRAVSRRR
jgi:membrane protein required for beta-lactamase induction